MTIRLFQPLLLPKDISSIAIHRPKLAPFRIFREETHDLHFDVTRSCALGCAISTGPNSNGVFGRDPCNSFKNSLICFPFTVDSF